MCAKMRIIKFRAFPRCTVKVCLSRHCTSFIGCGFSGVHSFRALECEGKSVIGVRLIATQDFCRSDIFTLCSKICRTASQTWLIAFISLSFRNLISKTAISFSIKALVLQFMKSHRLWKAIDSLFATRVSFLPQTVFVPSNLCDLMFQRLVFTVLTFMALPIHLQPKRGTA